jgi:hypothetical protein
LESCPLIGEKIPRFIGNGQQVCVRIDPSIGSMEVPRLSHLLVEILHAKNEFFLENVDERDKVNTQTIGWKGVSETIIFNNMSK